MSKVERIVETFHRNVSTIHPTVMQCQKLGLVTPPLRTQKVINKHRLQSFLAYQQLSKYLPYNNT